MTTLVGLDLAGRRVLVAGAGAVGTRRARGLAAEGAHVVLVDPTPSDAARELAAAPPGGRVELLERAVRDEDVDAAWLVVAATANADGGRRGGPLVRGAAHLVRARRDRARPARWRRPGTTVSSSGSPRMPTRTPGGPPPCATPSRCTCRRGRPTCVAAARAAGAWCWSAVGPGTRGLVTLAGLEALAAADVVVADRLGTTGLLERLPPDVEVVEVGKTAAHHPVPQVEINRLLVERALLGQSWCG